MEQYYGDGGKADIDYKKLRREMRNKYRPFFVQFSTPEGKKFRETKPIRAVGFNQHDAVKSVLARGKTGNHKLFGADPGKLPPNTTIYVKDPTNSPFGAEFYLDNRDFPRNLTHKKQRTMKARTFKARR